MQGGTLQSPGSTIVGVLFGTRGSNNHSVSVIETTDIITETLHGVERITGSEIEKKIRLWTAVYTQYELVGWYTFGNEVTAAHIALHESLTPFTKALPLFLLFSTVVSKSEIDKVPLKTFFLEEINQQRAFVEHPFRTVSYEVEKIAVNQITNSIPTKGLSKLEVQNQHMLTSIDILDGKIGTMMSILEQMRDGKIKVDHNLLRSAQKICKSLDAAQSDKDIHDELDKQLTDSLLLTYLNAVQKSNREWKEVCDLHELTYERHHK